MVAVVGVIPAGRIAAPHSALTNVDLPWLNSPSTTSANRSSSSLGMRDLSSSLASVSMPRSAASFEVSSSAPMSERLISRCSPEMALT